MRSVLSQLQDDQAILLMYLADELPAADRAVVEKRLATEPALRAELESLRITHARIEQSLSQLDSVQPMPATPTAMQWKIARMIRQWQVDRALHEPEEPLRRGIFLRFAPAYPFVAAAAVLLSFIVWWGLRDDPSGTGGFAEAPIVTLDSTTAPSEELASVDTQQYSYARTEADLEQAQEGIEMIAYLRSLTDADMDGVDR
jgi:anti-sigma factor RsiW